MQSMGSSVWTIAGAAMLALALGTAGVHAQRAIEEDTPREEAIQAHLDEAEDLVEALLEWRIVLTEVVRDDPDYPQAPNTTLIPVERDKVVRLAALVDAITEMTPARPGATPRGDLPAHAAKAKEITRELMPAPDARPVGTTGAATATTIVDRTALERLEIELDAMERLIRRQLNTKR